MILSLSYYNQQIIAIKKKTKNKIKTKNINAILKEWIKMQGKKNQNIPFIAKNLVEGPQQWNCNCKTKTIL